MTHFIQGQFKIEKVSCDLYEKIADEMIKVANDNKVALEVWLDENVICAEYYIRKETAKLCEAIFGEIKSVAMNNHKRVIGISKMKGTTVR